MKTESAVSLLETEMALETFTLNTKARITLRHLSTGLNKTEGCSRKTGAGYYNLGRRILNYTNPGWEAPEYLTVLQKRLKKYSGSQQNLMAS